MGVGLSYLDASTVDGALARIDAVACVRQVLELHARGETVLPAEAYLPWQAPDGTFSRSLSMPGLIRGGVDVAGTKIINANLGNPDRGLPRAAGLVVLFDLVTARPRWLLDGTAISALRTAAVSACAVGVLASSTAELGLVGCGPLGAAHLRLLAPASARIRLYDRVPERAAALAADLAGASVVGSAEQAVRGADVVVLTTTTTQGYVPLDWLRAGSVVLNVSLDDVLPDVVLGADLVVVDDWSLVADDDRRLVGRMLRQGQVTGPHEPLVAGARRIDAELGAVLTGAHPGRTGPDQIVLVNPFGMAIADLAVAAAVTGVAARDGGGQWLPFG